MTYLAFSGSYILKNLRVVTIKSSICSLQKFVFWRKYLCMFILNIVYDMQR